MVIRKSDRVSAVLAHDESLIDVFVGVSPAFEKLRNPRLRKVMSRLVTVEQAARIAGVDADELVRRLNAGPGAAGQPLPETREGAEPPAAELPAELRAIPAEKVVEVDVREDLRAGREPFSRIMASRREIPEGGALCVRAIFEPVPLYEVMGAQGLAHHTERLAGDDWRVWFYPAPGGRPAPPPPAEGAAPGATDEEGALVLDVRGLEPPEPMLRTLAALEELPAGGVLVQVNVRVPQFLLPLLDERGFAYELHEQEPGLVRVVIRRATESSGDTSTDDGEETAMTDERILDVRVIPPPEKHPTIFRTFAALASGESFVLVNDHDPKPLRYQFEAEHAGEFGWQYLEQGPEVWRVEISKT